MSADDTEPELPSDLPFIPFSRTEAIELAIRTAIAAHVIACAVTVLLLSLLANNSGLWIGLGVSAVLAAAFPFLVLPAAFAIGVVSHLFFKGTPQYTPTMVKTLVILLEGTVFGWTIVTVLYLL